MSQRLLEYAEALRTGTGLKKARKLRRRLVRESPDTIAALEAEMPFSVDGRKGDHGRRRQAHQAVASRNGHPRAGSNGPTSKQTDELRRLANALGRPTPQPPTRQAASFEINRLRQVLVQVVGSKP